MLNTKIPEKTHRSSRLGICVRLQSSTRTCKLYIGISRCLHVHTAVRGRLPLRASVTNSPRYLAVHLCRVSPARRHSPVGFQVSCLHFRFRFSISALTSCTSAVLASGHTSRCRCRVFYSVWPQRQRQSGSALGGAGILKGRVLSSEHPAPPRSERTSTCSI
jgi:hypothetical protein